MDGTDVVETESPKDDDWIDDELIEDDLLVEEISIDGMCGVY
jgi:mycofactocin precursor